MTDRVIRIVVDAKAAEEGGAKAKRALADVGTAAVATEKGVGGLTRTMGSLKTILGAAIGSVFLREFAQMSDTAKTLTATLSGVETSMGLVAERQKDLVKLSLDTQSAYGANVELYAKSKRALDEAIGSQGNYLRVTETVNKALKLGGADTNTSTAAIMSGYGCFEDVMAALDHAVSRHDYVAGDRFTADVYFGSHIGWGMQFGSIEKRPVFERYWARLVDRPAAVRAREIDDALLPASAG